MKVFALADPHLSLATADKSQDKFGPQWVDHAQKINERWRQTVDADDLVLVAGDISWAMRVEGAQADLDFLSGLPGTKVLIRGNHDYWWSTANKVRRALRPGMYALHHDAIRLGDIAICGTRLWDVPGVTFDSLIDWRPSDDEAGAVEPPAPAKIFQEADESAKIYTREVDRLRSALNALETAVASDAADCLRIVMTHYPPCDAEMNSTAVTQLLEAHRINHTVFGHLHSLRRGITPAPFGFHNGVNYHLTACDYLDFTPKLIAESDKAIGKVTLSGF